MARQRILIESMSNPAFDLAAGLVARAEEQMPQPMQSVPPTTIADWVKPAIMDYEDALLNDTKQAITRLVAGAQDMAAVAKQALELVAAQRERADRLHAAIAEALLALTDPRDYDHARTILKNALDAERKQVGA